jgi:hypothetical protein
LQIDETNGGGSPAGEQWMRAGAATSRLRGKDIAMFSKKRLPTECRVFIYAIAASLWRWEIRSDGALLRCGTSRSEGDAKRDVRQEINR